MRLLKHLILAMMWDLITCQSTKKENVLLSRKRRYLVFPDGANFVFTMVYVKIVMVNFPTRVHMLGECDVPFKLPSDTRWYKRRRRIHRTQKRDVYSTLELALNEHGFNGTSCVKRMLCEAQSFVPFKGKSMLRDMLATVFDFEEFDDKEDHNFKNVCDDQVFVDCETSLIDFIIGSLTSKH